MTEPAELCDVLYEDIYAQRQDVPFYVELARESAGTVLEAACGTGRVLIPCARASATMVGFDIKASRLHICRGKLEREPATVRARVTLSDGDMRTCDFGSGFALITMPFRGFQDLLTPEDQHAALVNMHRHLRIGGRIALDVFNPSIPFLADESASREFTDGTFPLAGDAGTVTLAYRVAGRDYVRQLQDVEEIIYVTRTGRPRERQMRQFTTRYIFRYELEYLLQLTGFDVEHVFGDFRRGPFGAHYPGELVIVARKR